MPPPPSKRAKTVASAVSGEGIPPEIVVVASERDDDFRGEDCGSPRQRVTTTQVDTIVNYSTPVEQPTRSNVVSPVPSASSASPVPPFSSVVSAPLDPNVITRRVSLETPDINTVSNVYVDWENQRSPRVFSQDFPDSFPQHSQLHRQQSRVSLTPSLTPFLEASRERARCVTPDSFHQLSQMFAVHPEQYWVNRPSSQVSTRPSCRFATTHPDQYQVTHFLYSVF
ncbi:hypothetical protein AVEN_189918-1 [Araneus ventricosus]|uniref:Uncharacterized protein n=1 Tax=Araneus ventricosus TaxID=182803 RepID=A0A4Y2UWE0_ARAVE|nr:hypothetical protein AVEN_189918-1 [Araneus ventricosus]